MSGVDGHNPLPADTAKEARDKDLQGEALRTVVPDWIRTGKMVKGIRLDPAEVQSVTHGLKRVPQGWCLMGVRADSAAPNANYNISETTRDASKLTLANNGSAVTVRFDLWVW